MSHQPPTVHISITTRSSMPPRNNDRRMKDKTCPGLTCTLPFPHSFNTCEPCGMPCTSNANYTAHVKGRKHRNNLVRGEVYLNCRLCQQNLRATSWGVHMSRVHHIGSARLAGMIPGGQITVDFLGYNFCAICRTHITNTLWKVHLTSLPHEAQKNFVGFKDKLRREVGENGGRVLLEDVLDFKVVEPLVARVGISLQATIQATSQSKISLIDIKLASGGDDVPSPFSISIIGRQSLITTTKSVILNINFKQVQVGKYSDTATLILEDVLFKKRFSISRRIQAIIESPELHMSDIDMVPPEVWSNILFLATRPPDRCYPLTTTTHKPFDISPTENLHSHLSTLRFRASIVLVSRQWNALALPYLYELLRIPHSSCFQRLLEVLMRDEGQGQVAHYVRCAILPYERDPAMSPFHILGLLRNLQVLIRPYNSLSQPPNHPTNPFIPPPLMLLRPPSYPLEGLKRIDCAERQSAWYASESLNYLPSMLSACTGLEYLSISGDLCTSSSKINLPNLITLRAERFVSTERFCDHWNMVNLRHAVLHLNLNHTRLRRFWQRLGERLCTIELAASPGDVPRLNDEVSDVLEYCPNLMELSYHIEFSQAPSFRNGVHTSLQALWIHSGYSDMSLLQRRPSFDLISAHFNAFSKTTTPSLEKVTLCGVWTNDKPVHGTNYILQKFGTSYVGLKVEREVIV